MLRRLSPRNAFALLSLDQARDEVPSAELVTTSAGVLRATVSGSGPPVLLIHGATDHLESFTEVRPEIAKFATVHAIDLPGHGLSDIPAAPLGVVEMAESVCAYMDKANIARAVVVGWSMGGGVALALAATAPSRVSALVLLGSIGLPFPMPRNLGLLKLPGAGEAMSILGMSPRLRRTLLADTFHHRFEPTMEMIDRYWRPWRVRGRAAYVRELLKSSTHTEQQRLLPWLSQISIPVHIMHGDGDRIVPAEVGRGLARRLKHATLHIMPGTGHSPHIERPSEVIAAVRLFALGRDTAAE